MLQTIWIIGAAIYLAGWAIYGGYLRNKLTIRRPRYGGGVEIERHYTEDDVFKYIFAAGFVGAMFWPLSLLIIAGHYIKPREKKE